MNPFLPSTNPQDYTLADVGVLIHNIIVIAVTAAGILATIYIIVGAFQYLTAFGDESKAEEGKKTITWAIIGLVLIILAQVAVAQLWQFFGGAGVAIPIPTGSISPGP